MVGVIMSHPRAASPCEQKGNTRGWEEQADPPVVSLAALPPRSGSSTGRGLRDHHRAPSPSLTPTGPACEHLPGAGPTLL